MKRKKKAEAYYCGWCFPAKENGYVEASVHYTDHNRVVIFHRTLRKNEDMSDKSKREAARAVLEHYLQTTVSDEQVERLLHARGLSICRMEPHELDKFRQTEMSFEDHR